ncbi:hypothetical protein [Actinomycetospora chlora]|uniref:hypothetical protein n=1 Tax=Actinomycetospora chlora TaxID=663608 RepID=UPI0031EC87F6
MTTWRHLLVWLHVTSSVTWMSTAAALAVLLGLSRTDPAAVPAAVTMAHHLDTALLAAAANASATTGFVLAWATPWGLVHHWWVLAKAAITLGQLYLGIAVLSPVLDALARDAAPAPLAQVLGAAAMAGAVAFQAWLSIAKPWPRTPVGRRTRRLPRAGTPLLAAGVLAPVADLGLNLLTGFPTPVLELGVIVTAGVARRRAITRSARGPAAVDPAAPADAAAPPARRRT